LTKIKYRVDENGEYDVPANINYILNVTSQSKLTFIGHSMGTTMFFIAMIRHPELNDKIDTMIALAPVASMAHLTSPVKAFAPHVRLIQVSKF
jgi:lysosomal acid lipase/cholesteryl ester hydrolase